MTIAGRVGGRQMPFADIDERHLLYEFRIGSRDVDDVGDAYQSRPPALAAR